MINDVKDGIVAALVAAFPGVPVFDEPVEQGIVEPSFSVRCVNPNRNLFRGKRYFENDLFEIVYFPPVSDRYHNSNETVEKLFDCLEILTLPDESKIRGRDMKSHTNEDFTVIFTVKYSDFMYKVENPDLMETLEENNVEPILKG
jgi:hypothetical protein